MLASEILIDSEMSREEKSNNRDPMSLPSLIMLLGLIGNQLEVCKWNSKLWEEMKIK